MKRLLSATILMLLPALALHAQTAPDAAALTGLLNEFLAGASSNDAAVHDRFWAEELVYTGSGGRRRGKAEVMKDVGSAPVPKPGDAKTIYTAEDVRIQQYGNTAIVAFRLVGTTLKNEVAQVAKFLNTGTFLKRHGKWQVVSWQATRMPRAAEESQKEVAATEATFHRAMLASDVKTLESVTDETFIWMHRTGEQMTRKQLLEQIGTGQLKYAKLETSDVKITVYGDTAVVRGVSARQRAAIPGSSTGEPSPFNAFYTLTFVNQGGAWKAVSMHTSWVN